MLNTKMRSGRHSGGRHSERNKQEEQYLNNVVYINTYYEFDLLADPDDNKFVNGSPRDCAVAGGANYIVSEDRDFKILEGIARFQK